MQEPEPRLFTLSEAERTRAEVEPVLVQAIEARRRLAEVDESLAAIAARIQISGGVQIPLERAARLRAERDKLFESLRQAIERIHATGCLVKDLEMGLLDFPARIRDEDVYLCWRLGEDRIRFYHRQDEGFAGRKPLDPRDAGFEPPVH
jgi:hypothetical protein